MPEKFLKPHCPFPSILDDKQGNPLGFVTNDGMWAAIPCGKGFMVIHNGDHVKLFNNYKKAVDFILNQTKVRKRKPRSSNGRKTTQT